MKLQLNKKSQIIAVALVIFTVFVGLSCAAAADVDAGSQMAPNNNILKMSAKFTSGTGFHWEVAPETHGVTLMSKKEVESHPRITGSSGTVYYTFLKQSPDYYVKLNYISPSGEIVKSINAGNPKINILNMSVKYNSGNGCYWEVAPETHGVTFMGNKFVQDHPKAIGTSGTLYFSFLKQSPDYYVKLNYMSPCGEIIKSVDSDMLN